MFVSDPGFTRWLPDETHDEGFTPTPGGLLDGLPPPPDNGSALHLFMESEDIATIPGVGPGQDPGA